MLIEPIIGSVTLGAGASSIIADGSSAVLITAAVADSNGLAVKDGTVISFRTTAGTIPANSTTSAGIATVMLKSSVNIGTAVVTATVGGVSGTVSVDFVPGPVSKIKLSATPSSLLADAVSISEIRADVTDASGNAVDGELISFSVISGSGTLSASSAYTSGGTASVTYKSSNNSGTEIISARAANGISNTVRITLTDASTRVGSVTVISGSPEIKADGSSQTLITATVNTTSNNPVKDGTAVTFTTTAGSITWSSSTTNGIATAMLTSSSNVGTAAVTATVSGVSGSVSVKFVPGTVSKIKLTATPPNILADASGTSQIRALVTDAKGNVIDGELISFSVSTGKGTLSAATVTTSGGLATVTYTASDTPGTEVITAKSTNGISSTVSITLTDATSQIGSVTVTSGATDIVANGESQTLITATVKTSSGNAVKDGTAVSFVTTAGSIPATALTVNGIATAMLTSSENVGTATVTATVAGVNGFVTVNFVPGPVSFIRLTAVPDTIAADGKTTSQIRAEVTDKWDNAVDGEVISFTIVKGTGTLSAPTAPTSGGAATVTFTSSLTAGGVEITAESANKTSAKVSFAVIPANVGEISLSTYTIDGAVLDPAEIPADGVSKVVISALVKDDNGKVIPDVPVTFTNITGAVSDALPSDNTFSGQGYKETDSLFYSNSGSTKFTLTHTGSSNFIVWLINNDSGKEYLVENLIGPVTENVQNKTLDAGNYSFKIYADGEWRITVDGDIESAHAG